MSASKRGKNNRRKGGEYEAELARVFTAAGIPATKEGHKKRRSADGEQDLHAGIFRIESKNALAPRPKGDKHGTGIHGILGEHAEDVGKEGIPIVVWKRPRVIKGGAQVHPKSEMVAMRLEDFLGMAVVFLRVMALSEGAEEER